ncbi:cardiolipin synthase [Geobacillus sp. FSL K6-0789]|uniref:Cardiolipin synthase n=1 Tax=Geobacillus stearothermophilus TaxID=1422 RepID=A0A087LCY9_GEOSE|nr:MULTISPECIES: cardiolipin synthase [Geobacillus]AKM20607.1 Minor cardiolipin synthase ClsB [Geobacillus sp. 12AMOR1]AKU26656.1 cardiolipin synthetase [Geobacillus sp. LC300]ASS87338.1 cardiolipin synthase [Geobacillus lituanicus]MED0652645.1 cardiolipin synthase [Anoxybacillus geothermalis]STO35995.1 Cardiolipin synthase [[Flavobacterium] thermophilum]
MLIIAVIVIIFALVYLDDKLGRLILRNGRKKVVYPKRRSDMALYVNGRHLFADYFAELRRARDHIHILFYIIKHDETTAPFFQLLKEKAAEGVEVRLLTDWVGSLGLPKTLIRSLKASGVEFAYARPPRFPFFIYRLNRRNHRKITVIDGKVGYMGGFNIGREYSGKDANIGEWRDYHLKISGEGVHDLQEQFLHDWEEATGKTVADKRRYFPPLHAGAIRHQLVATDGAALEEQYIDAIRQAKREIMIGSPYFIPSRPLFDELMRAIRRGVRVTVIVPLRADHLFVREAAYPYFYQMLKAGARIYRFYQGFYHAKTIVVDEEWCDVGTANFDRRSLFLNGEINCYVFDRAFTQVVKRAIQRDLTRAEPLTLDFWRKRSLLDRGKESISQLISAWL